MPPALGLRSRRRARVRQALNDAMFNLIWIGGIPLPLVDALFLGYVQLHLLDQICDIYDVPFSRHRALIIVGSVAGGSVGALGRIGLSSAKVWPLLGGFGVAAALVVTSAAATYALAKLFVHHLEEGGELGDFHPAHHPVRHRQLYQEGLTLGKRLSQRRRKAPGRTQAMTGDSRTL